MPTPDRERVAELERMLALQPHPEGGAFREHHRAPGDASTAIYFLLKDREVAAWHRLRKDELWHHYEGDLVELHLIHDAADPRHERVLLGPVSVEARPCRVVPAGVWQAARRVTSGTHGYALVGNTVAPAFSFADWSLADRATLEALATELPDAREVLFSLAHL